MRASRGFTLIELLVVIAIIAVLMGVLLPSLGMARMHAKRLVSTSNLRQIGLAMELYSEDNRGLFPESSHGLTGQAARQRSWIFTLAPYVGDVNEVRVCPADPQRKKRLEYPTSSYIMNEYIAVDAVDPFGRLTGPSYRNKYKLKRPAETMTVFVWRRRFVGSADKRSYPFKAVVPAVAQRPMGHAARGHPAGSLRWSQGRGQLPRLVAVPVRRQPGGERQGSGCQGYGGRLRGFCQTAGPVDREKQW